MGNLGGIIMSNMIDDKELLMVIKEMFLGYNERKKTSSLYNYDRNLPKLLIKLYYELDESNRSLDELTDNFIHHYINSECVLENTHEPFEKDGLKAMYEYIHSEEINQNFSIFTLLDLHSKLYSAAPFPDAGGHFRNDNVYLPTTGINLADWRDIWRLIKETDYDVQDIMVLSQRVKNDISLIFEYIEKCVALKCKLIKIHPFWDGNGRTVRGFINRLFLNVGLPSIYVSENEDQQYRDAMQKAIGEESDLHSIIQFYYYKICDSIFELDIYPKINSDKFNLPEQVINLTKKYTESLQNEELSPALNRQICDDLTAELTSLGIHNERYCTTQIDETVFPHDFILVYYKTKDNSRLLIDPMFSMLERNGKIEAEKVGPVLKNALENLKNNGVASISNIQLHAYIDLFNEYEKQQETSIVLAKKRAITKITHS